MRYENFRCAPAASSLNPKPAGGKSGLPWRQAVCSAAAGLRRIRPQTVVRFAATSEALHWELAAFFGGSGSLFVRIRQQHPPELWSRRDELTDNHLPCSRVFAPRTRKLCPPAARPHRG